MKYPKGCIIQFAKLPRSGKVKTRLIPDIGAQKAQEVHERLTRRTLNTCVLANLCPVELWLDREGSGNEFVEALTSSFPFSVHTQKGADLGERMAHAVEQTLQQYDFVVLVGSDCAVLDTNYLRLAVESFYPGNFIPSNKVVLGPAEDGGYVLIGMHQPTPEVFKGIAWGGDEVFNKTLERINESGGEVVLLPQLWDVDIFKDLQRLAEIDTEYAEFVAN